MPDRLAVKILLKISPKIYQSLTLKTRNYHRILYPWSVRHHGRVIVEKKIEKKVELRKTKSSRSWCVNKKIFLLALWPGMNETTTGLVSWWRTTVSWSATEECDKRGPKENWSLVQKKKVNFSSPYMKLRDRGKQKKMYIYIYRRSRGKTIRRQRKPTIGKMSK